MKIIEYLPDPFTHALSWSLLHSIWQVLAIALLWQVSLWFARKAPAYIRQNLSLFALVTIPVVFIITFIKQYSVYSRVSKIAFVEYDASLAADITSAGNWYLLQKDNTWFSQFVDQYTPIIFWLYWIGIALFSIWSVLLYTRLYYIREKNLTSVPDTWLPAIEWARQQTHLQRKLPVWLSSNITVPLVTGFFKPVVLFPLGISSSLTMKEVEDILLHEFYHVSCNDHYVNALQHLLEILFFYHPCTWWISSTLRSQRESKVDEWIVRLTDKPVEYAQTLISLEEKRKTSVQQALAATASYKSLLYRIKNIMHMKTRIFKPGQKIAAIMVIVLATLSLAWLNPPLVYMGYNDYSHQSESFPATSSAQASNAIANLTAENQTSSPTPTEPNRVVLEDGNAVDWDDLSEEDKEEIRAAIREAQVAVRTAMQEVQRELNSEEFKQEMETAREEIRKAMEELHSEINSDEFKANMKEAHLEVRRAMKEAHREINSEEFKQEMRQAREEIKKAMQEVHRELNSDEFKQEMQKAREEIRKAIQESDSSMNDEVMKEEMEKLSEELQNSMMQLEYIPWAELGETMGVVMQEVGKTFEILGPTLGEIFSNFNLNDSLYYESEK